MKRNDLATSAVATLVVAFAALATGSTMAEAQNRPRTTVERGEGATRIESPLVGRIELRWRDTFKASRGTGESDVEVFLVDDKGVRRKLDAEQAFRAAGDLHRLNGKRVAVTMHAPAGLSKAMQTTSSLIPEVIVPVDDPLVRIGSDSTKAAITGTTPWVTVMCKFSDDPSEPYAKPFYQSMYDNTAGRLDHYWREVSHQKINLTGSTAVGWFTLPQPRSYYVTSNGIYFDQLANDCMNKANASVYFPNFYGVQVMLNGLLDGAAYGNVQPFTIDGVTKNYGITWMEKSYHANLSYVGHEMGHGYNLSHSNNSDNDGYTYDNPWDIMSGGVGPTDPTYGPLANHPNAYARDFLGWFSTGRVRTHLHSTSTTTYTVDRASLQDSTNTQLIKLIVPGSTTRYYTIEARKKRGTYESALPGEAVIIHSVRTDRPQPSWVVDAASPPADFSNKESNMFKVGESWTTPDATGSRFKIEVLTETQAGYTVRVSSL